jgi:hypothetical protein
VGFGAIDELAAANATAFVNNLLIDLAKLRDRSLNSFSFWMLLK